MHLYEWVLCIMYVLINGGALYIYCSINHILVHGRFKSLKKSLEVNAQFWNNHLNPLEKSPHNSTTLLPCTSHIWYLFESNFTAKSLSGQLLPSSLNQYCWLYLETTIFSFFTWLVFAVSSNVLWFRFIWWNLFHHDDAVVCSQPSP